MNTSIFNIKYERQNDLWHASAFVPPMGTITQSGKTKKKALKNFHRAAFNTIANDNNAILRKAIK